VVEFHLAAAVRKELLAWTFHLQAAEAVQEELLVSFPEELSASKEQG